MTWIGLPEEQDLTKYVGYWKQIEGFEGLYEVNQLGEVRSMERIAWNGKSYHILKSRILKGALAGQGYYKVALRKNKQTFQKYVHRLVAETFLEQKGLPQVNHIDGNKINNKINNIEWCTSLHNLMHAKRLGLNKNQGDTHYTKRRKWLDRVALRI